MRPAKESTSVRVILRPSLSADVRIDVLDCFSSQRKRYTAPAMAAAIFMTEIRGLPLDQIDIETPSIILSVVKKDRKLSIIAPKCKLMLSKHPVLACGEETLVTLVSDDLDGKIYAVYECDSLASVDQTLLRALSFSSLGEPVAGAVAVCRSNRIPEARAHVVSATEEQLLILATATACATGISSLLIGGSEFAFSRTAGRLTVTDLRPTAEVCVRQ